MSTAPTSAPESPSANGRETNGRSGKDNEFGPDIPFARHVASLRTALVESVTPDDMRAIAARLVEESRGGDKTATKLLFQYVIGKPQPAVDPDRLAVEAFRALQQSAVPPEVIAQIARGVPLELVLQLLPILMAAKAGDLGAFVKGECERMDNKDRRREERAEARAERKRQRQEESKEAAAVAPSTNGDDGGANGPDATNRPSTNGDDGDGVLNVFLNWLRGGRNGSGADPQT
jgi:hypothetical protein